MGGSHGQGLLGAGEIPVAKLESVGKRSWHMPWYCLFGDCDVPGWSSYAFSSSLPCIAQGFVRRAAFGHSVWMWSLVIMFLLFPFYFLGWTGAGSFVKTKCTYNETTLVTNCEQSSMLSRNAIIGMMCYLAVCWAIYAVVGAVMRSNIRQKFNISGTHMGDCALWCCCSMCAMAQETRTVLSHVHNGQWGHPAMAPTLDEILEVSGSK
eukprot:evm.model.scf_1086.5 EVM.evm.TU.scf_1086.5   scf_1086:47402-49294(-)